MTIRRLCLQELDNAILISEALKVSITRGNYRTAINQIADLLFVIGQSLTCINRLEFAQSLRRRVRSAGISAAPAVKAAATKRTCIQLVNAAIANFRTAKRLVAAGRYEDAENVIAATLTGRILRCVNSLR